jgi:hypothetical protein
MAAKRRMGAWAFTSSLHGSISPVVVHCTNVRHYWQRRKKVGRAYQNAWQKTSGALGINTYGCKKIELFYAAETNQEP